MKLVRTAVFAIAAALAPLAPMAVHAPAAAEQAAPRFKHVPLTVEKGKAAIDTFLMLREKYPPNEFRVKQPGPIGVIEAMKASPRAAEITADVRKGGFKDIDDWAFAFTSLGLALGYVQEGEQLKQKLKELDNAQMPDAMKQQIRAMMQAMMPPEQNVEVVRELLADPATKKKIDAIGAAR